MNRRDAIKNTAVAVGAAFTLPALAQTEVYAGGTSGLAFSGVVLEQPIMTPEERKKQYAICKERGHTADHEAGHFTNASYTIPPRPAWEVCKFCRTSYRTVVTSTQEETNQP